MSRKRVVPSAFYKTILRSIHDSLGRFLAIMGIVALGCGFYAGLQMCGPDMRSAADALYDGTNLYDIRLVSTMGFSENDVERVKAVEGIDEAMAAISADAMARLGSEQLAVRMSSLDVDAAVAGEEQGASVILSNDGSYLNRVFLREGRWPEGPAECVISADKSVAGIGVGDSIEVLYGATELDGVLRERVFTVVGTVSSPTYPYTGSFGSTTLGSGMIGEYVYVAPAAFEEGAPFTEMYLTVAGANIYESGSDAYREAVDVVRRRLEGREELLALARLDDLRADEQARVSEGRAELEERRKETFAQLDETKSTLEAAKKELESGQKEYDSGMAAYEQGRTQANEQIESAQRALDEQRAQLEQGRSDLETGEKEVKAGEAELLAQLSERGFAASSLASARMRLASTQTELEGEIALLDAVDAAQGEVTGAEESIQRYEQLIAELGGTSPEDSATGLRERAARLAEQVARVTEALEQSQSYQDLLVQWRERLEEARASLAAARERAVNLPSREELERQRTEVVEGISAIGELDADRARLVQARVTLALGEAQLKVAQEQLDARRTSALAELEANEAKLSQAKAQLDDGRRQYEEGLAAYEEGLAEANRQFDAAQRQLDDAQATLDALEPPDIYALDRSQSEGALTYDADSRRMDSIADVFPLVFFLVAALVALTTMTRMVDDDRIEIGTYKALGYSTARIASKYLLYAGIAGVLGAVLGILVLSQVLPFIVTSAYSIIYAVPLHPFPLPVHLGIACTSGGLGVGITLLATWAAVVASLRETPATLMLPRAPAAGKRILLERAGIIWHHLSFSWKVTCRNLFRYKRRLSMTVIGISGCAALLLVGFGLHDAIWDIIDGQYGPIIHYDTTVGLDANATELDVSDVVTYLEETGDVSGIIRVQQANMQAGVAQDEETIRVQVIVPQSSDEIARAVTFRNRLSQEAIAFNDDAVVITEKLAMKYGLAAGDDITLFDQDAIGNVTGLGHKLRVSGVAENYVGNLVYVGRNAWREVDEAIPVFSTIFASTTADEDVRASLAADLHDREDISTVIFSDETINLYRNMLSVVDMIVVVLIVSAGLLAFIVLYNLTNINIGERVREIASLKVLGFTHTEVYAYIFREIAILAVLGDVVGMVLGTFLATFVITTAEVDYVMFGRTIHTTSYAYSFALTLLFTGLILLVMRHKLDHVNMVESLKSVE